MACKALGDEYFSCPVCYEIYMDPVLLSCFHTFCRACLMKFWEEKGAQECPLCRKISQTAKPPCNLVLKNICEAFQRDRIQQALAGAEIICNLHNEKLKLFCLDDQRPVCVVCRDSNKHRSHRFREANEAACDLKEELRSKLKPLQDNLRENEEVRSTCEETIQRIKLQAVQTEKEIKAEFAKLYTFLQNEEKVSIAELRKDEEQKCQMLKKRIEELNRTILLLTDSIRSVSERIEADNNQFLQMYKATLKRTQCNLKNPESISGVLIDVSKHLGNLKCNVWQKMKDVVQATPVIFDPKPEQSGLQLTTDLSTMGSILLPDSSFDLELEDMEALNRVSNYPNSDYVPPRSNSTKGSATYGIKSGTRKNK